MKSFRKWFVALFLFGPFLFFNSAAENWDCCELEALAEQHWEFQELDEFMAIFEEGYRLGCW